MVRSIACISRRVSTLSLTENDVTASGGVRTGHEHLKDTLCIRNCNFEISISPKETKWRKLAKHRR